MIRGQYKASLAFLALGEKSFLRADARMFILVVLFSCFDEFAGLWFPEEHYNVRWYFQGLYKFHNSFLA